MDDSFDELVPDNWLELPSKRKLEEPAGASISSYKHPRLSASSSNDISVTLSSRTCVSHDSDNSDGTNEDTSVNEPDFTHIERSCDPLEVQKSAVINGNNHSDDDVFSRMTQTGYSSHDSENGIVYGGSSSELHMKKCLTNNLDSRILSCLSTVESKDVVDIGYEQISKEGEPGCSKPEPSPLRPGSPKEPSSPETISRLKSISSLVTDARVIADIVPNKDFSTIYELLLEHRDKDDRLDIVTFQLTNSDSAVTVSAVDIFEEVRLVSQAVPSADVNEIYALLEQLPPSSSRVQDVITKVKPSIPTESSAQEQISLVETSIISVPEDDSVLENDPLFQDMRIIAKLFPEKDRNEIYALLEAKFNQESRLESVINEILYGQTVSGDGTQESQAVAAANPVEDPTSSVVIEDSIEHDVDRMRSIFPDCDPNYLFEKLDNLKTTSDRTTVLAAEMFEKHDYPKLKDVLDKEQEKEKKEKARQLKMSEAEFLQKFPDPVKTFSDCTKEPSAIYRQHADVILRKEFPMLKYKYLEQILQKYNGHLYPAYREISALVVKTPLDKRKKMPMFLRRKHSMKLLMPDEADEYFYHELWFVYNELSVVDHTKQKELQRQLNIENARATGQLHECCCCFDDECLLEDLASCPDGHLFCKTCVIRSTQAAFGEMKTKFPCLTGECSQDIPLSFLQTIIPAGLFSKIVRRLQEEEVQQANIPDLVTCPFCPFAAIMPDPDDRVFKCLNPECLKESCRLCREPSHIPLRCNEVEKKAETGMRVYIENKISEAVMRKCHKCGKRFVKDDGCNKMTCVCGATSCYACKATDIGYEHFNHNKKCANTDPSAIHQRDMEEAAVAAKNQYLLEHPEAADIQLKTDVKDMIQDFKRSNPRNGRNVHDNQGYDDDEEDEDVYLDDSDSMDEYGDDETDDYDSMYEYIDGIDVELDQYPYNPDYEDDDVGADGYNTVDEYLDDIVDEDNANTEYVDYVNGDIDDYGNDYDSDADVVEYVNSEINDDNPSLTFVDYFNGVMNYGDNSDDNANIEFVDDVSSDTSDDDDDNKANLAFVDYVNGDNDDENSNIEFIDYVNGDMDDDDIANNEFVDYVDGDTDDDDIANNEFVDYVDGDTDDDDIAKNEFVDYVDGDTDDDGNANIEFVDYVNGDVNYVAGVVNYVDGDKDDERANPEFVDYADDDLNDDEFVDFINGDLSDGDDDYYY